MSTIVQDNVFDPTTYCLVHSLYWLKKYMSLTLLDTWVGMTGQVPDIWKVRSCAERSVVCGETRAKRTYRSRGCYRSRFWRSNKMIIGKTCKGQWRRQSQPQKRNTQQVKRRATGNTTCLPINSCVHMPLGTVHLGQNLLTLLAPSLWYIRIQVWIICWTLKQAF